MRWSRPGRWPVSLSLSQHLSSLSRCLPLSSCSHHPVETGHPASREPRDAVPLLSPRAAGDAREDGTSETMQCKREGDEALVNELTTGRTTRRRV